MVSYLSAGSITKNLRELVAATKRIASGDFGVRLQPASRDEVAALGHSVNNMASRIQTLMSTEVEKARFEKELETARMVQSTFFPKTDVSKTNLSVTGSYQPATECGGDLWGHYTVRENVELIFIADAMGHGAPAALVTAIAYAVCQSVSTMLQEKAPIDPSPAILLKRLNKIIYDAVAGKISMTFFAAIFDFNTGKITFANAGHNFPFILSPDKSDPRLGRSAKNMGHPTGAITLTLQGNPLGVEPDSEFKEKSIDLKAGDKLVFFTDGLIENSPKGHEPLGRKLLIETACQLGLENIDIVRQQIQEKGASIFGTQNLSDDVTIVVAEINKTWQKLTPTAPTQIPLPSATMSANSMPPGDLPLPLALHTESSITPNPMQIESIALSDQSPGLDQPLPIGSFVLELGSSDDKTEDKIDDKTDEKNKEKTDEDVPVFSLTLPTG
jgi:serine phosphatase RsbU (regulator of sigma subunit)